MNTSLPQSGKASTNYEDNSFDIHTLKVQLLSFQTVWLRCVDLHNFIMEKYRLFDRIIKTKWFSFYQAENTESREAVTVKKLHKETTWEEVLKNKNISLMSNSKAKEIASIREIVKDDASFYCIFDNLDLSLDAVIRRELQKEDIFKISRTLIQMVLHLTDAKILPRELRPSSLFVTSNFLTVKIAHLEAFASRDLTKLDLVELQDLRYSSPESVLTSKDIDERSLVFAAGLLISELILGRPLLTANTKMNYIYQLCKLFPEESIAEGEQHSRVKPGNEEQRFQAVIGQYNFSNQFIALLREMLKIDRSERIKLDELLEAFDLIVANEENFIKENQLNNVQANLSIKPNATQAPINNEILEVEIDFDFDKKPTLSAPPVIKSQPSVLPPEKNVDDDAAQPIIIKKSSKPVEGHSMPAPLGKDATKGSRTTKQQTISTVKRPQLTNYAINEGGNLGVKLGFQPTLFSENENDF